MGSYPRISIPVAHSRALAALVGLECHVFDACTGVAEEGLGQAEGAIDDVAAEAEEA